MKVLHIPFCFYPDAVGGTEVYVAGLVEELVHEGVESVIAAPDGASREYIYQGTRVRRFGINSDSGKPSGLFGNPDGLAVPEFAGILDAEKPDLVHLHALPRVALRLLRTAKRRAIPTLYTYHTVSDICARDSMMHWGTKPCDGVLCLEKCSRCVLQGRGFNRAGAWAGGSLPGPVRSLLPILGDALLRLGVPGKIPPLLMKANRLQERHSRILGVLAEANHIVAPCEWGRDVLLRNGVPKGKISLCRQGAPASAPFRSLPAVKRSGLQVAYFGRLDKTKGVDLLIRAVRNAPDLVLKLDIFGVVQEELADYERELKLLCGNDPRIEFRSPVPSREVIGTLRAYDILAVPSQNLETGPLVVFEAFAAGIPVVGSRLGGIAELVDHGRNGILVESGNLCEWQAALRRLCFDPQLLSRLSQGIKQPRTMSAVAHEMAAIYEQVVGSV